MVKLRPCPFCPQDKLGVRCIIRETYDSGGGWSESEYRVECPYCGGKGPAKATKGDAAITWNTRPIRNL